MSRPSRPSRSRGARARKKRAGAPGSSAGDQGLGAEHLADARPGAALDALHQNVRPGTSSVASPPDTGILQRLGLAPLVDPGGRQRPDGAIHGKM